MGNSRRRKRRRSQPRGWSRKSWPLIGVAALALVAVSLVTLAMSRPLSNAAEREPRPIPTYAKQGPDPVTVAFVGDSFTGGSNVGGFGDKGWPALLSDSLGFYIDQDGPYFSSQGGTGYLRKGDSSQTIGERIGTVIDQHPDIIVMAGGINDAEQFSPAEIEAAAGAVFARFAAEAPEARIVVLGPFYPRGNAIPESAAARDSIFRAATANGITTLVDPLPWFDNGGVEIGADNTHPTDAGHAEIARQLLPLLTPIFEAERAEQPAD